MPEKSLATPERISEYVVDADGHACEPADLWERNLPSHLADRGIRLRWNEATGYDECLIEDRTAADRGLVGLGNAGEPYDDFGRGRHYEDLNPAGFDPEERVKVLDAEGIDFSVMYPGLGLKLGGVGALPLQNPVAAAEVAREIKEMGLIGGFARPCAYNERPFFHPVYNPLWETLEELELALALHPAGPADMAGASRQLGHLMAPGTHHALILQFDQQMTLSNLVYGGVLEQFPGLKVAVLECGGGWIGHWMDRMNEFLQSYHWAAAPLSMEPADYFRRQCWISFHPGERTAGALGPIAGADRFIWASDFPHSDAKYPGVVDKLRERNHDLPDDARRGLYGLNALDLCGLPHPV